MIRRRDIKPDNKPRKPAAKAEHTVTVKFNYSIRNPTPLYQLEERLREAIEENELGEYDGHGIAMANGNTTLFMYGPDAKKLYRGIRSILRETSFLKAAEVTMQFGPPGKKTDRAVFTL